MAHALVGADKLRAFLKKLIPYTERNARQLAWRMARETRVEVQRRYQTFSEPPSGISLQILTRGKEYGPVSGRPSRRPLGAESIMSRLSSNVTLTSTSFRRMPLHRIQIDPKAKHPHGSLMHPRGVPLAFLAYMQESRTPSAMPVTHLMRTYLRIIREGRGGYGTRKRTKRASTWQRNFPTGRMIVIIPPHRPVWSYVIQNRLPRLMARFAVRLSKRIQRLAQQHDGKPRSGPALRP